jgi:hypothetical protein
MAGAGETTRHVRLWAVARARWGSFAPTCVEAMPDACLLRPPLLTVDPSQLSYHVDRTGPAGRFFYWTRP